MLPASARLLFRRDFGLLWWSGVVSDAGTWMQTVAVGALVTELTDSAGWGALVAAVTYLLSGLVTPYGGAVADHRDRRRLLIWIAIAEALAALVLAVVYAAGDVAPWVILLFVAFEGTCVALVLPARAAILPSLVRRNELVSATALGSASWNLGRTVGPALAGLVVLAGSYTPIFIANAVSFALVAVAMFFIRVPAFVPDAGAPGAWGRVKEGFVAVRDEPGCRLAVICIAYAGVLISPFIALVPAMAQIVFDRGPEATAQLVVAQGIGSVVGAVVLGSLTKRFGRNRMIRVTFVFMPLVSIAYAFSPSLWVATAAMVVVGAVYVWLLVGLNVVVQLRAPEALRGRAMSLYFSSLSLFYPIGAMAQGWLGDVVGVREVLAGGAVIFGATAVLVLVLRPRLLDDLDERPAEPAIDLGEPAPATVP